MDTIANIVVATDFSPGGVAALAQGVRLSKAHGAMLHVIHVVPKGPREGLFDLVPDTYKEIDQHLERSALEHLRKAVAEAGAPEARCHACIGSPVREIADAVERVGAELLVLGATGEGERRLGTVAGRCIRKGPTRVLLVPPGRTDPFRDVVAAIDFGELTRPVVEQAARIAEGDSGSVTAVHVYALPWELARWGGVPGDALEKAIDADAMLRKRFEADVAAPARGALPGVGLRLELVKSSDGAAALVRYANEHKPDLIVTGTTGRSTVGYMLLGTTAEKLMRDTDCAVLALKR